MNRRGVYQLELVAATALIAGVCLALLLAIWGSGRQSTKAPDWKPVISTGGGVSSKSEALSPSIHYVGIAAGGCAVANCHGGVRSLDDSGNVKAGDEWKTSAFDFLQHDPHAQAYNVLFEERSRIMIDRLARGDEALATGKIPLPGDRKDVLWYAGQLEKRCVSCHSTPLPKTAANTTRGTLNDYALGVTCEACHGPASRWGDEHLSARWGTNSTEEIENSIDKRGTGFNELENLSIAATTCAKCHIGDGSQVDGKSYREVTHDLIAAGHPRLDFDFAAWYASMPAHWNREREKRKGYYTDAWLHGQVGATKAFDNRAVKQGYVDADNARRFGDQPEWKPGAEIDLAMFDCFACHRALRFPPADRSATVPVPTIGSIWTVFDTLESKPQELISRAEFSPAKLANHLAENPREAVLPRSYDELLSWYYAADAVSRDAAFAAQSSPDLQAPAKTMETSLGLLKAEMENYLARDGEVSRYVSPSGFGIAKVDAEKPEPDAVQTAFEEAKQAVRALAAKWER